MGTHNLHWAGLQPSKVSLYLTDQLQLRLTKQTSLLNPNDGVANTDEQAEPGYVLLNHMQGHIPVGTTRVRIISAPTNEILFQSIMNCCAVRWHLTSLQKHICYWNQTSWIQSHPYPRPLREIQTWNVQWVIWRHLMLLQESCWQNANSNIQYFSKATRDNTYKYVIMCSKQHSCFYLYFSSGNNFHRRRSTVDQFLNKSFYIIINNEATLTQYFQPTDTQPDLSVQPQK